jgi:putative flippase GtrA
MVYCRRFFEFALVGGSVALAGLFLQWAMVDGLGWNDKVVYAIVLILTLAGNYALNHTWTFKDRSHSSLLERVWKYVSARMATLVVSWLLFAGLMLWQWGIPYQHLAVNVVCLAITTPMNYISSDSWVFKHKTPTTQTEGASYAR